MSRHVLVGLLLVAGPLLPATARANCAMPLSYGLEAGQDGAVRVQPFNFEQRGCGGDEVMLRQDVATGDTVRLAEFCGTAAGEGQPVPYVDECVPAGQYRYGFRTPYACNPGACSTDRWEAITVPAPPGDCALTEGNPGTAVTTPAGWGSGASGGRTVCTYGGDDEGTFGCATAPGASGAVLLLDGLALALGWALLRRRARRA